MGKSLFTEVLHLVQLRDDSLEEGLRVFGREEGANTNIARRDFLEYFLHLLTWRTQVVETKL